MRWRVVVDAARQVRREPRVLFGIVTIIGCLAAAVPASVFAHKPHPVHIRHSERCPLVDGRGGNFDTAKTDAMMKSSRCWLTV